MSWSTVSGDVGDDKGFSLAGGSPSLEVVLSVYSPTPFSVLSLSLSDAIPRLPAHASMPTAVPPIHDGFLSL